MCVTTRMTPVIFHATLVDQRWPKHSQPSSVPDAAVTLPRSALDGFCMWPLRSSDRAVRQPSARWPPSACSRWCLALMGRKEDRSLAKHKAKERGREKTKQNKTCWKKNPSLCCRYAKSRTENGSHNRGGHERSWRAIGQLRITAISRQLGQEELVFVLVVWLHIPEAWLSFSLGIMTRWSSSNNVHDILGVPSQEKQNPGEAYLVVEFFVWFYYWRCELLTGVWDAPGRWQRGVGTRGFCGAHWGIGVFYETGGSCWGPLDRWWWRLFCDPIPRLIQWAGRQWLRAKGETWVLSYGIVTPADGIIPNRVVCNPVSMN